jgi:hypothetical protein
VQITHRGTVRLGEADDQVLGPLDAPARDQLRSPPHAIE